MMWTFIVRHGDHSDPKKQRYAVFDKGGGDGDHGEGFIFYGNMNK